MSALSRSKNASCISLRNMLSIDSVGAAGGVTGGGALTVTRIVESAEPPGPVALIEYVVESDGVTLVEPSGATAPTSGEIANWVALVDDQFRVADSPLLIVVGLAVSVTVGRAGGAAGAGGVGVVLGFLLHPAVKMAAAKASVRQAR